MTNRTHDDFNGAGLLLALGALATAVLLFAMAVPK